MSPSPDQVLAVVSAYQKGLSYGAVSRESGLSESVVRTIMEKHAPGAMRRSHHKKPTTRPAEEYLTLASLGLNKAGPCERCGCEIVSYLPGEGQLCGFCKNPAARFSGAAA